MSEPLRSRDALGPCRLCGRMVPIVRWKARGKNHVKPAHVCRTGCGKGD